MGPEKPLAACICLPCPIRPPRWTPPTRPPARCHPPPPPGAVPPACLQTTVAKLLGARGLRSAFETVAIIVTLFTLSPLLAATLLVSAPLLTPLIARLTGQIGAASKAAQVGRAGRR